MDGDSKSLHTLKKNEDFSVFFDILEEGNAENARVFSTHNWNIKEIAKSNNKNTEKI